MSTKTTEELVSEFGGVLDALMAPQDASRQGYVLSWRS